MCLAQGHNAVPPMRFEPHPFDLESSTVPLSHWAPCIFHQNQEVIKMSDKHAAECSKTVVRT